MWTYNYVVDSDELYHHGVLGMKWGVRKAYHKLGSNSRYMKKALNYDVRSANQTRKAEKAHSTIDLARANKKAVQSAKYYKKAAKFERKANEKTDGARLRYEKKAAKAQYKGAKLAIDGNRISRTTGYGIKSQKYAHKADKYEKKAAKVRLKIAKNKVYIDQMNRKVSSLSKEELGGAYSFVNDYLKRK